MAGGLRRTTLASYRLENWCPFGLPNRTNHSCTSKWKWWRGAELNRRHKDFQSSALPTELPSRTIATTISCSSRAHGNCATSRDGVASAEKTRPFLRASWPWGFVGKRCAALANTSEVFCLGPQKTETHSNAKGD